MMMMMADVQSCILLNEDLNSLFLLTPHVKLNVVTPSVVLISVLIIWFTNLHRA